MVERRRRRDRLALYENAAYVELRERIAMNVRRLREARELTQAEAAFEAEIGVRLWQAIESGESNLTLLTIARVAAGLDVDPSELFERAAKPTRMGRRSRGRPRRSSS